MPDTRADRLVKGDCLNTFRIKIVPIRDLESFDILIRNVSKLNARLRLHSFKSRITWSVNPFISKGFGHFRPLSASFEE